MLGPAIESAVKNGTRVELALLRSAGVAPTGTAAWLGKAPFSAHHHLTASDAADHDRLARRLSGRAWGLVLGGGGARGFAHIGVIRALLQGGLPVDMIGGTSMGAILAAQFAMGCDTEQMLEMTRRAYVTGPAGNDLTLPCVSLHTGRATVRKLKAMFGDRAMRICGRGTSVSPVT